MARTAGSDRGAAFGPAVEVPVTRPFDAATLFRFLRAFAVPGVERHEVAGDGTLRLDRALTLPSGPALLRLVWDGADLSLAVAGDADPAQALAAAARTCDAAADVVAVAAVLGADPHLAGLVASSPGLRLPGAPDPYELVCCVLVSQQVSMKAAARCAEKIAVAHGGRLAAPGGGAEHLVWPRPEVLARVDPEGLPMPRARGRALVGLAAAAASGALVLDPDAPWPATRAALLACPGIGPWTADAVGMRGLGQTDLLLDTDLVIRRELTARGVTAPQAWSPYRSYATVHLWRAYV